MSEEFLFVCSECNSLFPADPDAIVETGLSRSCGPDDDADEDCEEVSCSAEALQDMSEYELSGLGLTPEIRARLLNGEEFIETGARCICLSCQDRLLREQEAAMRSK